MYNSEDMPNRLKKELPPLEVDIGAIGNRIAKFRKERGLTQKELAKKVGILHTLVSDYERGKTRLFDEMIVRFALALEVSTDELLGLQKEKTKIFNPSLKIIRRLKKIEELPLSKQKTVLQNLDLVLQAVEKA